jgi:hypothetical protein
VRVQQVGGVSVRGRGVVSAQYRYVVFAPESLAESGRVTVVFGTSVVPPVACRASLRELRATLSADEHVSDRLLLEIRPSHTR